MAFVNVTDIIKEGAIRVSHGLWDSRDEVAQVLYKNNLIDIGQQACDKTTTWEQFALACIQECSDQELIILFGTSLEDYGFAKFGGAVVYQIMALETEDG